MTDDLKVAARAEVEKFQQQVGRLREEIGKVIVGNREVIDGALTCMLAGAHALLEGVPGLGKTVLVKTMAEALALRFSRIQFTPDLMPADIIGTTVIDEDAKGGKLFEFRKGPIFANIVLADEINRATPKTQSALLEAMQEHRVTVAKTSYTIEEPFFVLATQNPLEMEGTYPLPEAQLDRFLFKLIVPYPSADDLTEIVRRTTAPAPPAAHSVADGATIREMGLLARQVPISSAVTDYVVRLTLSTPPEGDSPPGVVRRFVRYGVSPRGAQAIVLGSKIRALIEGRLNVAYEDVRAVATPALRHRLILNFDAESSGVDADAVIADLIATTPE